MKTTLSAVLPTETEWTYYHDVTLLTLIWIGIFSATTLTNPSAPPAVHIVFSFITSSVVVVLNHLEGTATRINVAVGGTALAILCLYILLRIYMFYFVKI